MPECSLPHSFCHKRSSPSPSLHLVSRSRVFLEHSVGEVVHGRLHCEQVVFVIKAAPSPHRKTRQEEMDVPPFLLHMIPSLSTAAIGPSQATHHILLPTNDVNRATALSCACRFKGPFPVFKQSCPAIFSQSCHHIVSPLLLSNSLSSVSYCNDQ